MAFFEELKSCFGKGQIEINWVYPSGLAVSGYNKIVELTDQKIELSYKTKHIIISGDELSIKTLAESEMYICGKLFSVEIL